MKITNGDVLIVRKKIYRWDRKKFWKRA